MFKELIVLNYFIFNRKNNIKKNYWKKNSNKFNNKNYYEYKNKLCKIFGLI